MRTVSGLLAYPATFVIVVFGHWRSTRSVAARDDDDIFLKRHS